QHARDVAREVARDRPRCAERARCDPDPRRERLLERVPGRALSPELEGGRDLRGHEPAAYAHPSGLRPRLPRGSALALRAPSGRGLRAPAGGHGRGRRTRLAGSRDARQRGSTRPRAGTADMSALTAPEQATLRLLAATFVPAADADRVATIAADALDRAVDPAQLRQLRLVLRLLALPIANLATAAGFVAFRDMPPVARERTLLRWSASPLVLRRSGVNAFRKLLTFIAYADPGPPDAPNPLPRAIGYVTDDPPVSKERAPIRPLVVDR